MIETFEDEGGGVLAPIISPIIGIANGFTKLAEIAVILIKLIGDILKMIPVIFSPDKLINDVLSGVINGLTSVMGMFFGSFKPGGKTTEKKNDGIFGMDKRAKSVCVSPSLINIIILVICPPLALYLNKGLKGWYLVILCCLMTYYLYYFPGFIFATLHILC